MAVCESFAKKHHYPPKEDYDKYPDLKLAFDEMVKYQMEVDNTGFEMLTQDEYIKMISLANTENEKRKENEIKKSIYLQIQSRKQ